VPNRQAVLAERYRDALIDVRKRVSTRVERNWRTLGSWNEEDVDRFLARTLPVVDAGQRRTVSLTDAYLARTTRRRTLGLLADDLVGAAVRNGTDPATVYRRPFVQLWSALSDGAQFVDAMNAAGVRAAQSAGTDVSLSMRASADAFAEGATGPAESDIIGWERVLDPDACAYCATASTPRYKSANLSPLHANCQCGIAPVFRENDRAIEDFNRQTLRNIKDANADKAAPYWQARHFRVDGQTGEVILPEVSVHEHGELGAVLSDAAHDFTGPADIAA
jgi:hypothetical protein